jgi:guanylate kinase
MLKRKSGVFYCLCSPAGAGKTTISNELFKRNLTSKLERIITYTSRVKRPEERNGESYFFIEEAKFIQDIENNLFFEWQKIHNNYYGVKQSSLDEALGACKDILLVIDIKGALTFKARYPLNTVTILILPPKPKDLLLRLKGRGTESDDEIAVRFATARREYQYFLRHQECIDYLIVNQSIEESVTFLEQIVNSEKLKWDRIDLNDLINFEGI